ncbi:MAG TPA: hypothetical protein PLR25_25250 [Planctomycetaceae bacterium]|nr:hypothetical protein [Planctomycetaceae bacterium]
MNFADGRTQTNMVSEGFSQVFVDRESQEITAIRHNLKAVIPADSVYIAHAGLRLLGSVRPDVSAATQKKWEKVFGNA